MIEVPIKVLDPASGAEPPKPMRAGDAAADLRASEPAKIAAGGRAMVGTGLAVAIPPTACGLVLPRSGLAAKHGVTLLNSPGLIDSGYRGELKIILYNSSDEDFVVEAGDRIAQFMILGLDKVSFLATDELPEGIDDRGVAGFGSSGVA